MYTNVNTPHELTSWNRVCDNIDLIKVPSDNIEEIEHEIKVYVDKDGKLYYYNDQGKKQYIESTVQNPPTTDKDIESEQNVGNVKPGDVIPGGSTITDVVDQIVGTADWTGTYPKACIFVQQTSSVQPEDKYNNEHLYLYINTNNSTKIYYNIVTTGGYFKLNNDIQDLGTIFHNPPVSMPIDMSYQHTIEISGKYQFPRTEAKDYELYDNKGNESRCVLEAKDLDYIKKIHICDYLLYQIKATNGNYPGYNKKIIYNDQPTSYDFTINSGQTLYLRIPNGYSYSIIDQNGVSIIPDTEGNDYKISIASTGVKSTFTITLNPNSEENDN